LLTQKRMEAQLNGMKHLVLLGGGHAHLHVLKQLARSPMAGVNVTLVSPFERQIYSGMVPGWLAGHYLLDDCSIALSPLAGVANVRFLETPATAIDAAAKQVRTGSGEILPYDLLSVDTGSVMNRDAVSGAREHALFVRPMEHFVRLSESLFGLAQSRVLAVVVIGGGAAGVELALALQHRLQDRVHVSLVTGGTPPLPTHPTKVQTRAMAVLRAARITVLQERCVEIAAKQVVLANGARLACDAPLAAWGSTAPPWLANSGLVLDDAGFIQTQSTLQSTSHPEVFAVGDVASRIDAPHPKSGVYAVRSGPPLFRNLQCAAAGQPLKPYIPQKNSLNLLACGPRDALASWGNWSAQGAWVWHWKNWIDRRFVRQYQTGFLSR
jgi:pyridine nucleotide-disulfide oxidoreductase family protein